MSNTNSTPINAKTGKIKISSRGGARANAGRPKGSTTTVTIASLLSAVDKACGKNYVEILAEDFAQARTVDKQLAQKYHNLILSKVAASLAVVEVTDTADVTVTKALAFADALKTLSSLKDRS